MQIFTPKYIKESISSLALAFSKLKTLVLLNSRGRQEPILKELPILDSGKRYLSLILLCLSMGFTGSVFAQANFVASPSSVSINPSDPFTVIISLQTASGQVIDGAEIQMDFDPTILQVTGLTALSNAQQLPTTLITPTFDNTAGTIVYAAGKPLTNDDPEANFQFLQIDFQAIGTLDTNIDYVFSFPFRFTDITLGGLSVFGNANNIPVTIASANPDPIADFTINPNPAETNEVVTFNGSLSSDDGSVDLYAWDFGDGTTPQPASSNASTTHSYTAINTYTVFLTVTDNLGATNTTSKTIVVNAPTVTQYIVNASSGPNGSIDPEGAVSVNEGNDQTFNFTPDSGFEVSEVLVNSTAIIPVPTTSHTLTNVTATADISVSFSEIATGPFQLCIASGSADLTAFGRNFVGDPTTAPPTGLGFTRTNGKIYTDYNGAIAGTSTPDELTLFQKEIYGGAGGGNPSYIYDIPVANGFYQVDLYFAEVFHPAAGGRIFDVMLDGTRILDEYDLVDPVKDGLSTNQTAITRTYFVQVTDGVMSLQIGAASTDNGKLSGICVTEVASANLHPVSAIGDLTYDALVAVADPLNIVDPESDVLSIVFNGMPASLTYNPATNQLEGTPLATDANSYTINAIISDGVNFPVTEEFTLVINPAAGNDPPVITAISDINIALGATAATGITVTDDNSIFNTTLVLYDKSLGGGNNPILPNTVIPDTEYSFTDNGSGSYSFSWNTSGPPARPGRSYLARVTTDDGVNPPVEELFSINVAQNLPGTITANTFANPLPWYGNSPSGGPGLDFSVSIEGAGNIGWIDNNDFVEYLINVPAAGDYDVRFNSSNGSTSATNINIFEEGNAVSLGTINVPNTTWGNFQDYTTTVSLANSGLQTLRLEFDGGVNTNEFEFTSPNDTSPTIDAIADLQVNEGEAISQAITVTDDNLPAATIEIFDVSAGGDNNPFNPTTAVAVGTLVDNTGGSYTFNWTPAAGTGRSYLARVTADDGVNPVVIEEFRIDVAQQLPGIILARTFNNPVPWYGGNPGAGFTVAIETAGNIGWTGNGEFVEYLINVPTPGSYNVRFSSSNGSASATNITILEEGNAIPIGIVNVPVTGWNPFNDYNVTVALANSGLQTLRLEFDGGVNTNEFEFTSLTGNTAPVVTITSPEDGTVAESDYSINFTGTAIDAQDGDRSAFIDWSSDLDGPLGSGASINATLSVGTHIITAEATDLGGPSLTGSATKTLIIVSPSPVCDVDFRVNAGGPAVLSNSGIFEEDQAASLVGGTAQTGTPSTYINTTPPASDQTYGSTDALVSNTTGYPDYLFQTERYSAVANPNNMQWSFPTGDGVFDVKILFNENWNGEGDSPRVFDVEIEGDLALDDYRPSVDGTQINIAKVEIYQATVTDGVLNINFIQGTQNPSVKGFDICFVSDLPGTLPPVFTVEIPDQNNIEGDTPTGLAVAANDPDGGIVTFSDNGTLPPGLSIDPTTGIISGSISTGAAASSPYAVIITATDDEPETETSSFSWTIEEPLSFPLCINSGNQGALTAFGKPFIADSYVTPSGGSFYNTPAGQAINGTTPGSTEEDLYQSEHWTNVAGGLQYNIPTGNGDFTIDLYMAELFANAAGARLLNISIEGVTVLTGLDLFGTYGKFTAATLTYNTTVNDGVLDIVITSTADNPKLNGLCVSVTSPNTPPTVTITGPVDINVSRGTNVNFTGQADDVPDGDISTNLSWSTDDTNASFASGITSGSAVDISFVRPGSTIVTADVTDSGGLPGTDSFTVNVSAPEVTFLTPANSAELSSTTVNVQVTPVDVLFANTEHFHFYINPPDENNLDSDKRISTASSPQGTINFTFDENSGLLAADGLGNGIVEGENTIIVFVADQFHNEFPNAAAKDVVTFSVVIPDTEDPVVVCPPDITVDNDAGVCGAVVNFTPTATDNSGSATVSALPMSGTFFNVGTTTVVVTAEDASGNTATCSFDVTVNDAEDPVLTCPADDSVDVDTNGEFILADYTALAAVSENCDNTFIVTQSPLAGTTLSADTQVTLSVTDNASNTGTCTFNVTISDDTTDPDISCPADIVVDNDADLCGAVVTFTAPVGTDERPGANTSQIAGLASGDFFPLGITTQTFQVVDAANNMATCSFTVTVNDGQAPDITCPADINMTSLNGNPIVISDIGTATALDNCPGVVTIAGVTLIGGQPIPDTFFPGNTQILWTATDAAGNSSTCIQDVVVNFTPSSEKAITAFSLPNQVGPEVITGSAVNLTVQTGTDLTTPIIPANIAISEYAMISPDPGTAQIFSAPFQYTVTAQDASFQVWTVNVTVAPDIIPPTVTCPADITVDNDAGECGAIVEFMADFDDNLPGVTAEASTPSGSLFPVGITQVTVTATDAAGLTATCSFNVTVNDAEVPVANNCPANIAVDTDPGLATAVVNYTPPTASDNCPGATVALTSGLGSGAAFPLGISTEVYTITDAAGLISTCSFTVTVGDNEPPTVTCPVDITVDNDSGVCGAIVGFMADFDDNLPGVTAVASTASGSLFPVGTTQVTVTATDAAGLTATCSFNVTVNDTEAPEITCPGDQTVQGDLAGSASLPDFTALAVVSDNCDPSAVVTQSPTPGTTVSGTVVVTLTATDADGNSASCSFNAIIEPATLAALTITPASITVNLVQGGTTMVNYVVDSDDASTLPTPAAMSIIDNATTNPASWASTTSAANQGVTYEVNFDATGLAPGTYNATLTAGPVAGYTDASIPVTLIVEPAVGNGALIVLDATTDTPLFDLTDGLSIPKSSIGNTPLGIIFNTDFNPGGVQFTLTGPINESRFEGPAPHSLFGDIGVNIQGKPFPIGNYTLVADPNVGPTITVNFAVTDVDPVCVNFDASLSVITNPSTCLGVGSATAVPSGGVSPYTYQWDNGETTAIANNLVVGPHSVIVGDTNGCSKTLTFTLTGPPLPVVTLAPFASVLNTAPAFPLTGGSPAGGTYSGPGVTSNTFNPAIGVGTYAITYSYTDLNGCSNTATQSITVTTETSNAALIVLDATDDSVLFALTDGLQINKADIGDTPLGIIYNSSLNPGGVQFDLTGPINESRFEGPVPHSLFGDKGVNIQGKPFPVGNYTLVADPNNGPTLTVNFSVIDGPPGNQSPVAVASGTVDPVTPFKINFSSAGSMDPDGNIFGYLWNFGDGMTSIAPNPMHIYTTGGTKTVTLTVTDNEGATGGVTIQVTAVDPNDVDKVVTFTLVDAVADDDIIDMMNNYFISNGTGINIRANTDPGVVGSVKFVLSGAVSYTRTESVAPYALYGDDSGNYIPTDLPVGLYTITATPYSASGGNGTAGQSLTINFSVGLVPLAARAPVNTMSIAPNPASENITMSFDQPTPIQEIMVFDVTGRLIRTIEQPLVLDNGNIDIKVYDLPIGTYFLKTRDDKGFQYQQQMVIDRY